MRCVGFEPTHFFDWVRRFDIGINRNVLGVRSGFFAGVKSKAAEFAFRLKHRQLCAVSI